MQFVVAETMLFNQLGFNTDKWRKSLNGAYALVHYDLVEEPLKNETEYTVYRHDDAEFKKLMASDEWTEQEEI
ncbi:hypothetical protein AALF85_05465 [Jeotgalicoccus halotolerans]|uniref:hypothetical protein n=1 Tax=Jeotgalicoccus halotolerans TaxID=157227 RepID=UPI0035159AB5